jgi:hypothetical protein
MHHTLRNRADAEEAAQQVLLRAFEALGSHEGLVTTSGAKPEHKLTQAAGQRSSEALDAQRDFQRPVTVPYPSPTEADRASGTRHRRSLAHCASDGSHAALPCGGPPTKWCTAPSIQSAGSLNRWCDCPRFHRPLIRNRRRARAARYVVGPAVEVLVGAHRDRAVGGVVRLLVGPEYAHRPVRG